MAAEPTPNPESGTRYATFAAGLAGRTFHGAVRTADRLGLPATAQVTRRKLWGVLPRRAAVKPAGGLKQIALSFDLDYQADTEVLPALVELLTRAEARATMFSIGKLVEADPGPYRAAADAGHEIANHTHTHPDNPVLEPDREFWHLSPPEMREQIARCQDALERHTGVRPVGFRTPHFKDAFRMMPVVGEFPELRYVSTVLSTRSPSAVPYFPWNDPAGRDASLTLSSIEPAENLRQLMIPLTACPGVRWSPFSSYLSIREPADPAMGAGLHGLKKFESLWQDMLQACDADGFASVYFDPMDVMRDEATRAAFTRMLRWAAQRGWSLTTLEQVEQTWTPLLRGGSETAKAMATATEAAGHE